MREEAEVVLQEVCTEFSEGFGVGEFTVKTCGVPCTGAKPGAGVHTELESERVYVIGESTDPVRKPFGILDYAAVFVALSL